jgi:signal transduction histidine kinase
MSKKRATITTLHGAMYDLDRPRSALMRDSNVDALMLGADAGLALFDADLHLLACNDLYLSLCGYQLTDVAPGASLKDLMRKSMRSATLAGNALDARIESIIARLSPASPIRFQFTPTGLPTVVVQRTKLAAGTVVESVRAASTAELAAGNFDSSLAQIAEAARTRMMHALDVMADGFALFDADHLLVVYNRQYLELSSGVADLIVPGVKDETLLRAGIERNVYVLNGMSREDYLAHRLHQHRNPGEPYEVQLEDGRWMLIRSKRTVDGGIVKTRADITEMKSRELQLLRVSRELHTKHAQFDSALNNMVQGLCMLDRDQRLIVCNRRYLEIYGFSPDVVKPGIKLFDILKYSVSLGNYTNVEADRLLAERPDPTRLSKRITSKQRLRDGRTIAVMNEPMADGGSIATFQDITELENHELRMVDYTKKLENSNRELQEFAYVASHDLQEPLRKIEAFGDRLVSRYSAQLPEEGRMFLDRMQNAANRMRRLINDLLAYSRVTTKETKALPVDLGEVLAGVLADLQVRIDESGATVRAAALPKVRADQTHMRQLLQNLIGNALKFRHKGRSPVIDVGAEVKSELDNREQPVDRLTVVIKDNGIGFDNRYKEQIFKIFQRLHGKLEYEGTGVGLATCRKIAERNHGSIDADGVPGEGATFTVTLVLPSMSAQDLGPSH